MELTVTMPKMLKIPEASDLFSVGEYTIRDAVQRGLLRAYAPNGRTILLNALEVMDWIKSRPYKTRELPRYQRKGEAHSGTAD